MRAYTGVEGPFFVWVPRSTNNGNNEKQIPFGDDKQKIRQRQQQEQRQRRNTGVLRFALNDTVWWWRGLLGN
jgi:hypothetical protein